MATKAKSGRYPTAYKVKAIKRVERGEGVLPVARELGISRKLVHDWIKAWKVHGSEGLNRRPGPKPGCDSSKCSRAATTPTSPSINGLL